MPMSITKASIVTVFSASLAAISGCAVTSKPPRTAIATDHVAMSESVIATHMQVSVDELAEIARDELKQTLFFSPASQLPCADLYRVFSRTPIPRMTCYVKTDMAITPADVTLDVIGGKLRMMTNVSIEGKSRFTLTRKRAAGQSAAAVSAPFKTVSLTRAADKPRARISVLLEPTQNPEGELVWDGHGDPTFTWVTKPATRLLKLPAIPVDKLAQMVSGRYLSRIEARIGRALRDKIDVADTNRRLWHRLHRPVLAGSAFADIWLSMTPETVSETRVTLSASHLNLSTQVLTKAKLTRGSAALQGRISTSQLPPKPSAEEFPTDTALTIPISTPYSVLNDQLRAQLIDTRINTNDGSIGFDEFDVYQTAGRQLVVGMKLRVSEPNAFATHGWVYATGSPVVTNNELRFEKLDWRLAEMNPVTPFSAWVLNSENRTQLRKAIVFDLRNQIRSARNRAEQGMFRFDIDKDTGAQGRITVDGLSVSSVSADVDGLLANVQADANTSVSILLGLGR